MGWTGGHVRYCTTYLIAATPMQLRNHETATNMLKCGGTCSLVANEKITLLPGADISDTGVHYMRSRRFGFQEVPEAR